MRFRDLVRMGVERLNGERDASQDSTPPPEAGEIEGQGLVTNLSQTGAMVERCSEPLDPGAKLVLRLKPAGGFKTVSVEAEVVRTTEEGFALRFTETSAAARDLLAEVIGIALGDTLPL